MSNVRESSSDENLDALFNLRENMLKTSYETISPNAREHKYPLYVYDLFPPCVSFFLSCDIFFVLPVMQLCCAQDVRHEPAVNLIVFNVSGVYKLL